MKHLRTGQINHKLPSPASTNKQQSTNNSRMLFNHKKYLKPALSQEQIKEIKSIFDIFDTEGRGLVNPKQLLKSLDAIGYKAKQNAIYQHILDLAADGAGEIQFQKFLTMLTPRVTEDDSREEMLQLFSLFDDQKSGFLTIKNLRRMVREFGVDIEEEELQKMIEVADLDRDGRVSQEEFYHFMTEKRGIPQQ